MNTPEQKLHLGGVETAAKLADRHARYLTYNKVGATEMVMIEHGGDIVGSTGYWLIDRDGQPAYESGWEVLTAHHGRGLGATAVATLMSRLKTSATRRYVYAFPTPHNPGSNGICRKLGFDLTGVEEVEYPKGVWAPHNVWRLDLQGFAGG